MKRKAKEPSVWPGIVGLVSACSFLFGLGWSFGRDHAVRNTKVPPAPTAEVTIRQMPGFIEIVPEKPRPWANATNARPLRTPKRWPGPGEI